MNCASATPAGHLDHARLATRREGRHRRQGKHCERHPRTGPADRARRAVESRGTSSAASPRGACCRRAGSVATPPPRRRPPSCRHPARSTRNAGQTTSRWSGQQLAGAEGVHDFALDVRRLFGGASPARRTFLAAASSWLTILIGESPGSRLRIHQTSNPRSIRRASIRSTRLASLLEKEINTSAMTISEREAYPSEARAGSPQQKWCSDQENRLRAPQSGNGRATNGRRLGWAMNRWL